MTLSAQARPSRAPTRASTGSTPEDTRRTAQKIKGARVTVMAQIGHFPMSEHPAQFRTYILPVLDEIRQARSA